jgi:hypothetical protein
MDNVLDKRAARTSERRTSLTKHGTLVFFYHESTTTTQFGPKRSSSTIS